MMRSKLYSLDSTDCFITFTPVKSAENKHVNYSGAWYNEDETYTGCLVKIPFQHTDAFILLTQLRAKLFI